MRTVRAWFTETTGGLPRTFWHLWTVTLINRLGSFVLIYMTLYLSVVRDFTPTTIGLLVGAQGAGAVVGTQLSGVLTDRWGRRKTLLLSNFSSVAVLVSLAFVQNVWAIGALLAAMGATLNMARPAFSAMIADLVPPTDRVRAYTLNYWAINLGFSGAALLAGIAAGLSFQLIFFINAGAVAVSGVLILLKIPETRPTVTAVPDSPAEVKPRGSIRVIAADKVFLAFVGLTFLPALLLMTLESLLPLQVTGAGLSQQEYGWIIATNGVVIVAGQLFIPKLVDGKRRSRVLALSCVFWAAGVGITGLVASVPMFMLTVLIWTIGEMLQTPANSATIADLSPVDMRGRYQSVFALSFQASTMIAPTLGGVGLQYLGAGWWGVGAIIGLIAALGNLLAEPSRERRLAALLAETEGAETAEPDAPQPVMAEPIPPKRIDDTGELEAVRT